MSEVTLGKLDELIGLVDGPCGCDDGTCQLCQIMGLLWSVRQDVEGRAGSGDGVKG